MTYQLSLCNNCGTMTNHLAGVCQKCKSKTPYITKRDEILNNHFEPLCERECHQTHFDEDKRRAAQAIDELVEQRVDAARKESYKQGWDSACGELIKNKEEINDLVKELLKDEPLPSETLFKGIDMSDIYSPAEEIAHIRNQLRQELRNKVRKS